jgi:hypothetical protein
MGDTPETGQDKYRAALSSSKSSLGKRLNEKPQGQEQPQADKKKIPSLRLSTEVADSDGRLTEAAKTELERHYQQPVTLFSAAGNSKTLYKVGELKELIGIFKRDPIHYNQSLEQVEFYRRHQDLAEFTQIVVPMTKVIEDQTGAIAGAEYPEFGISVPKFKEKFPPLTVREIEKFIQAYGMLIAHTGIAHGDFVVGKQLQVADHSNIRIDPQSRQLKFLDYNGQGGTMNFHGQIIRSEPGADGKPTNRDYRNLARNDHMRLREALYHLFEMS